MTLDLASLDDTAGDNFTCRECEESFSLDFVRDILERWPRVVTWVESAPDVGE